MAFDALEALAAAGNQVDLLSGEQKAAVSTLTEHEVEVLTSIQARLSAVSSPEVEGQDVNMFKLS